MKNKMINIITIIVLLLIVVGYFYFFWTDNYGGITDTSITKESNKKLFYEYSDDTLNWNLYNGEVAQVDTKKQDMFIINSITNQKKTMRINCE